MRAVLTRTLVIVNPFSRDGATGRLAAVERRLREVLGPLEGSGPAARGTPSDWRARRCAPGSSG